MNPVKFIYTDINGRTSEVTILQFVFWSTINTIVGIMVDSDGDVVSVPIDMLKAI